MKKLLTIPAAALAAFAMTACEDIKPGDSTYTWTESKLVSTTERPVGGGPVITTYYEWDEQGVQIGEYQTVGSVLAYKDTDFTAQDVIISRIRTVYEDDGVTVKEKQKRVSTLQNILNTWMETRFSVYAVDAEGNAATTPFEDSETEYNSSSGNPTKYTLWKNGVEERYQYNYEYNIEAGTATFIRRDGGEELRIFHQKTKNNLGKFDGGYEMFIGTDVRGIPIERRVMRTNDDETTISYDMTYWDNDGTNERTVNVTLSYQDMTFSY